ncbi:MAG: fused nuclease/metallophosphatase/5'-nucleotidase/calcium-binding protein, partial [Woeseiaceae bacterium]
MNKAFTATFSALTLAACGAAGDDAAPTSPPPPAGATSIATVQGSGTTSPIVGQTVTVGGIVTGDFQDNDADAAKNLGGFYVQTEMPDGDDRTSDGLFVFDGTNPATDVDVGDAVSVTGDVQEFFGETQISASFVSVTGSGTILATDLNLPVAGATTNDDGDLVADLERYEGMLVRFPQTLSITELFNLERYGEVRLSQNGRLFQFTNDNSPDAVGYASHRENNAVRTLLLDDGKRQSNVSPIRYLDNRLGDTVSGLTGVLRYSRGSGTNGRETWRLMPTIDPVFVSAN